VPLPPNPTFRAPSLTVSGLPNGTATFDTTPTYSGTATSQTASIARVEASVDGAAFSTAGINCAGCGSPSATWTFSPAPLGEGDRTLRFRAVDTIGLISPTLTRTVTIDTTAPTFDSITATPGSTSVTATFSQPPACSTVNAFDFTAEINNSAVNVTQAACSPGSQTVTLTLGTAPGAGGNVEVTLSGVISDAAGNIVPRPTTRSDSA
jgi:hypothetical protein